MTSANSLYKYILRLADDRLILSHRLSELCGHGPILEEDLAISNTALDLLGTTNQLFEYAAEIYGGDKSADDIAFLRKEMEYSNLLICEQHNGDFAETITRLFFFNAFDFYFSEALCSSKDEHLAAIGEKSIKEVTYHLRHSSQWMLRLGDGTEESHNRLQNSVDGLWMYVGEMFESDSLDTELLASGIAPDLSDIKSKWQALIAETFDVATIKMPESDFAMNGGRNGRHSEALGHILSDMQYIQRTIPGANWD